MPVKIVLHREFILPEYWTDKRDWDDNYKDDREALVELLEDDEWSFFESAGGIDGMLQSAEWVDEFNEARGESSAALDPNT
jgi:hypothetical protein